MSTHYVEVICFSFLNLRHKSGLSKNMCTFVIINNCSGTLFFSDIYIYIKFWIKS